MTVTIHDLRAWKTEGTRWAMLTAYDFPTAEILDGAGIPVLLVGDSVGRNALGYENELPVTMEEMLHHTRAVARGAERAMVVGDMPFMSFQVSVEEGVRNAGRFIKEGDAHAVKIEGAQYDLVHRLVDIGIPVMAHIGLTPQSVYGLGGYRVQGRGEAAAKVLDQAHALEKAGAFAMVLEAMPAELGAEITKAVQVPTIGIGAGNGTDAQVLVINDLLGLSERPPKLAKAYADLRTTITDAATAFARDVESRRLPRRRAHVLVATDATGRLAGGPYARGVQEFRRRWLGLIWAAGVAVVTAVFSRREVTTGSISLLVPIAAGAFAATAALSASAYRDRRDPGLLFVSVGASAVAVQYALWHVLIPIVWTSSRSGVPAYLAGAVYGATAGAFVLVVCLGLAAPWRDRRGRPAVRPALVAGIAGGAVAAFDLVLCWCAPPIRSLPSSPAACTRGCSRPCPWP